MSKVKFMDFVHACAPKSAVMKFLTLCMDRSGACFLFILTSSKFLVWWQILDIMSYHYFAQADNDELLMIWWRKGAHAICLFTRMFSGNFERTKDFGKSISGAFQCFSLFNIITYNCFQMSKKKSHFLSSDQMTFIETVTVF